MVECIISRLQSLGMKMLGNVADCRLFPNSFCYHFLKIEQSWHIVSAIYKYADNCLKIMMRINLKHPAIGIFTKLNVIFNWKLILIHIISLHTYYSTHIKKCYSDVFLKKKNCGKLLFTNKGNNTETYKCKFCHLHHSNLYKMGQISYLKRNFKFCFV